MIRFCTLDIAMPELDLDAVRSWVTTVVEQQGYQVGELWYYFCSDETLLSINRERLGHDFYTDIITFPLDDGAGPLNREFCISLDRVADNALQFGCSYESELLRTIIHGVLHLVGFDDLTDEDRTTMRSMEQKCLKIILNS